MRTSLAALVLIVFLSACGHGYYAYETETVVTVVDDAYLNVELSWGEHAHGHLGHLADFDLELITPEGFVLMYDSGSFDGCYHDGDAIGAYGIESVGCSYPIPGYYEARVINYGDVACDVTVTITYIDSYGFETVSTEVVYLEPWGIDIIPVHID